MSRIARAHGRGWRARPFVALAGLGLLAGVLGAPPADARRDPGAIRGEAAVPHGGERPQLLDVRTDASAVTGSPAATAARRSLAGDLGPLGIVDVDPTTGTPRTIARLDGYLTGESDEAPRDVALGYVRAHLDAFGLGERDLATLTLARDYVDVLGTHHLVWEQRSRGVPAWEGLRAHVAADGRLIAIGGSPVPGLAAADVTPEVSAAGAVRATLRSAGAPVGPLERRRASAGPQRRTSFRSGHEARLVLFAVGRGPRLAWRTTSVVDTDEIYVSIVDARSGDVLWRSNLVRNDQPGTGQAWDYYPSDSVPNGGGLRRTVTFPVADATRLSGNTATVIPDTDDDDAPDRDVPATSGLDWSYPAQLDSTDPANSCSAAFPCSWRAGTPFSWQAHVDANAVQVYYFLTTFHAHLLASPIGFTEAAGNFQVVNASGAGEGGDPVVANVMDGADTGPTGLPDENHSYNANMFTPPDGESPRMQMYLFPTIPQLGIPSTTGGDDASVVYHEYTHGLSSRLVTYADGTSALNSAQAGAMGEAWSDFYAMDFLVSQGYELDGPAADVVLGRYVMAGQPGILRWEPIDCRVGGTEAACPGGVRTGRGGFTYGDFGRVDFGPQVHSDGEIWGQTLWDIRTALGSDATLTLVTRAMELSPPEPSFLDMRNAILQADLVAFDGANADLLWQVFAARGMGFFAVAIDGQDVEPQEDFSLPPECPGDCGVLAGRVLDRLTGRPVRGVAVEIAGHASGFLGDLSATTNAKGRFRIADVPFHGYVVNVRSPRHEPLRLHVDVDDGVERRRVRLTRDWASLAGGARLRSFSGPDYSPFCGPEYAWDTSLVTGWGSDHPDNRGGSGTKGPRVNVVRLPRAIDVSSFGFATDGTCGDGRSAAVKTFRIRTRTPGGGWVTAYSRSAPLPRGVMNTLRPTRGTERVRFVKLIMLDNYGDPLFMDVLELSVRGRPA